MSESVRINGHVVDGGAYRAFHARRIEMTLAAIAHLGGRRLLEVGGHPWVMTAAVAADPRFELCATVSAEEVMQWPDDVGVTVRDYELELADGSRVRFPNYTANAERCLFDVAQQPDTVLLCEVLEHLIRAPHVLLLNANRWLAVGGRVIITTPNGAQFRNPLRVRSVSPGYRSHVYARHAHLFTLDHLRDLVELCGFSIVEDGYWDPYARSGPARVYGLMAALPWGYCRSKFRKTLYMAAEKRASVTVLPRRPRAYDPSGVWELIATEDLDG